jgi:hypothetical protein
MEIAFASSSLLGHLTPLIPYMEVLLERGHTITCFHDSNPQSRKKLESCGLLPPIEQAENHSSGTYNENTKSYISRQYHMVMWSKNTPRLDYMELVQFTIV